MAGVSMKLTVERNDGSSDTYTIKPVTIVAFERQFATGIGSLETDRRMEYLYWLAWDAEKRAGKIVKPFDGWLDEIADVDPVDEAAAGPLSPAAIPGA
jgi:hypothetical protein